MESLYRLQNVLLANTSFAFRRNFIDSVHWDEWLTGVLGARGVGKTTCMLQYISENFKPNSREALYVTYDNPAIPYKNLFELADDFYKKGGKHLFVDEIRKYPHWAIELKNIYDLLPKLKITFSGSSILKLLTGGVDLSRRAVLHYLSGLSYREKKVIR
ncbi:MAG: AAA family ATPase [Bacteroidia bacterium]|nr:AAA family ATPase [Bacteroidia bacterium]